MATSLERERINSMNQPSRSGERRPLRDTTLSSSTNLASEDPELTAEHDRKTKIEISLSLPPVSSYRLVIKQQPQSVEASEYELNVPPKKNNSRKKSAHAIEPMPVLELVVGDDLKTNASVNVNPNLFNYAKLLPADPEADEKDVYPNQLTGGHVTSLFRYKKEKFPQEHGYFIFQDLRVKYPGQYRISFTLCEVVEGLDGAQYVLPCAHVVSQVVTVFPKGRPLPDPLAPTRLIKYIESGGAKLRYRKAQAKKAKPEEHWGGSLQDTDAGRIHQRAPGKRSPKSSKSGSQDSGLIIQTTSSAPNSVSFSGTSSIPQPGMYQSPIQYNNVNGRTDPGMYSTTEAPGQHSTNYSVPQVPFTFNQTTMPPMGMGQPIFNPDVYDTRAHQYGGPHYGSGLQGEQHHAMTGAPVQHNVMPYATNVNYSGSQIPEQRQFMNGQYSGMTQYSDMNTAYNAAGNPINPEQQYPQDGNEFPPSQQFYQG